MALNQTFPRFRCGSVAEKNSIQFEEEEGIYLPFRKGGNVEMIVNTILHIRHAHIDSVSTSGKTTVVPRALAKRTGKLVVLVLPYVHLAAAVHDHVTRVEKELQVEFLQSVDQDYPPTGLAITFAGLVVAKWLQASSVNMPECYLFHDELHEVGAASAALRMLGPSLDKVKSYITMSATADASDVKPQQQGGTLFKRMYSPDMFEDPWSVAEVGAPWSISGLKGHCIIYEDDEKRAQDLCQAYSMGHVSVRRWHSRTDPKEVVADLRMLAEDTGKVVVIIADTTFRSGFSLPVTTIIDSGKVRRLVVSAEGRPIKVARDIYEVESMQTSARGARTEGDRTAYWRPFSTLRKKAVALEQTDNEALAMILVLLGYKLPSTMANTVAAAGRVPVDVFLALDGGQPIACLPGDRFCHISDFPACAKGRAGPQQAPTQSAVPESNADIASGVQWIAELRESLKLFAGDRKQTKEEEAVRVAFGSYMAANNLFDSEYDTSFFPDGERSVVRMLGVKDPTSVIASWDEYIRSEAIRLLLNMYNSLTVQLRGSALALRVVRETKKQKDPDALSSWATRLTEGMAQVAQDATVAYRNIFTISAGYFTIGAATFDMSSDEALYKQYYLQNYESLPTSSSTQEPKMRKLKAASSKGRSRASSVTSHVSSRSATSEYPPRARLMAWVAGRAPLQTSESLTRVGSRRASKSSSIKSGTLA